MAEHSIKIGDTLKLGEHDFVVTNYQVRATREGRELTLICYDPMSVLQAEDHKKMQKDTLQQFTDVLRKQNGEPE